jgi:hypothetical protein
MDVGAGLGLTLTACGGGISTKEASLYMQGLMDSTYLGVYDPEYLDTGRRDGK